MNILFLDIDGVLNDHDRYPNGYCGIHPDKVKLLDRIVAATACRIVIVSAWRYMLLGNAMNLKGFGYLLQIHGASDETADALLDCLPADRELDDLFHRGQLAREWLNSNARVTRAVALDDQDLGYFANSIRCVRTASNVGLTESDAEQVIRWLTGV